MKKGAIRISSIAVSSALVAVFTLIVRIPSFHGGYISLCDAAIFSVSPIFPPSIAFIASGAGAAAADIIGGYPQWALISLIAHGTEGLLISVLFRRGTLGVFLSVILGVFAMVFGYFFLTVLFSLATVPEAALEMVLNTSQAVVGALFGVPLSRRVVRAWPESENIFRREFKKPD